MDAAQTLEAPRRRQNILTYVLLAIIAAWPFLLTPFGVDFTDTGYALANYEYAFSGHNQLFVMVCNWLGGLVFLLFPSGQLFVLRLLWSACYAVVVWMTWATVRDQFSTPATLCALALASALAIPFNFLVHYNTWTYLFLSVALYFLYKGLQREKATWVVLAGVLVGINVFNRMTNIMHLGLVGACFWYEGFCLLRWKRAAVRSVQFLAAALATVALFMGIGVLALGMEQVTDDLSFIWQIGTEAQGVHSISTLVTYLCQALRYGLKTMWLPLAGLTALSVSVAWVLGRFHLPARLVFGIHGLLWFAALLFGYRFAHGSFYYCMTFILFLVSILGMLTYRRHAPHTSLLCAFLFVCALSIPLSSGASTTHLINYFHLPLVCVFGVWLRWEANVTDWLLGLRARKEAPIGATGTRPARRALCAALVPCFLAGLCLRHLRTDAYRHPYRDQPYAQLTDRVQGIPVLRGIRTSPVRSEGLKHIHEATQPYAGTSRRLLALGHAPLAVSITGLAPFYGHSWPDLSTYAYEDFEAGLVAAEEARDWPLVLFVDIQRLGLDADVYSSALFLQKIDRTHAFLEENEYALILDDPDFQLYDKPAERDE